MPISLNFSLLPNEQFFTARSLLIGLPKPLESRISALPLTLDRAQSAVMFAAHSGKQSEEWRAAAYLRAALAEFCSMEEVQKTDKPSAVHFKFEHSAHPLLHLLDLTRHLNIHIKSVGARRHTVPVSLEDQEFDLTVYIMIDLNAADLAQLRDGKRYAPKDLHQMVTWFSNAQLHWGAGDLVRIGVEAFAQELCDHYSL